MSLVSKLRVTSTLLRETFKLCSVGQTNYSTEKSELSETKVNPNYINKNPR